MAVAANFTGTPLSGNASLSVVFTDSSTGSPDTWDWDFGDGSPHGTTQNPTHIYTVSGVYSVTLIATDSIAPTTDTRVRAAYVTVNKAVSMAETGHGVDAQTLAAAQAYIATYRTVDPIAGSQRAEMTIQGVGSRAAAVLYFWANLPAAFLNGTTRSIELIDVRPTTNAEHIQ